MSALQRIDATLLRYAWIPNWTIFAALLIFIVQAMDREPPFAVLQVYPAQAKPGDTITLNAEVWRDPQRQCSAVMGRSVFDSKGARWDYPLATFSAASISRMESATPGRMSVSLVVPPGAAPGTAELLSVLEYKCNQAHVLWPISVTTHMTFTVLP